MVVQSILKEQGLQPVQIDLGVGELREKDIAVIRDQLEPALQAVGFELLDDKKTRTIENIKHLIIDLIQNKHNELEAKLSEQLRRELHQDYSTLSNLFSEVEGITIEKYYILQKIAKVKELLVYDELSLSEIADRLNYSSVAYLSNQFKKITGLPPSHFKKTPADQAQTTGRSIKYYKSLPEQPNSQQQGKTVSYLAVAQEVVGYVVIGDKIKATSTRAIKKLQGKGIAVVMLTGDNSATAQAVANDLGLADFKANMLPEDKLAEVERRQELGEMVAMAGDGINDAPRWQKVMQVLLWVPVRMQPSKAP